MVKHGNQPCPNICQLTIELTRDSQTLLQDYYFEHDAGFPVGTMEDFAIEATSAAATNFEPLFANDVTLYRAIAVDLTSLAKERYVKSFAPGAVGTATGTSSASNVAWSVQKLTGNRGKGRQGRIMWGPIPEVSINGNNVDSTCAGTVVTAIDAFIAAIEAVYSGTYHVVLSRWDNKVWRNNGVGIRVTGMGYTNLIADSMKLRLPQHKRRKLPTP